MLIFADKQFDNPLDVITAFNSDELRSAFNTIETLKEKYYLAGYIRYETKDIFQDKEVSSTLPYLYFEVFDHYKPYMRRKMPQIFSLDPKSSLDFVEYDKAIQKIKMEIAEGNTYEVNYTHDYYVDFDLGYNNALDLFEYLLPEQTTPYNAFIYNRWDTILSFSPELFFRIEDHALSRHITVKPMKGTIRRGRNAVEDAELKEFLQNDIKNRAENVMIVDLMRNDLGQIAHFGSVRTDKLFEIETHPTLHQMTSQIEADIPREMPLYNIFKALFPCGSITGAPKLSTMNIIEQIECGKRGVYCGALGLLSPAGCQERVLFSVPIRILRRSTEDTRFKYRTGGAIVWDSSSADEWKETITKARFLYAGFRLVETKKVENGRIFYFKEHLARLKKSACYFGFVWNDECLALSAERDGIMRLLLDRIGTYAVEYRQLTEVSNYNVRISPLTVNSEDIFLRHKTTYRPFFQTDYSDCFDELFFNERGELTEGSRTSVIVEQNGAWWTPPETCGLLNGIYRQILLNEGRCKERVLYRNDLMEASALYCVNSVRGIVPVHLVDINTCLTF